MTLTETIQQMFSKRASSPAQRAVNAGAPDAAKDPTDGQKRVGNYRKVHLNLDGFRISIENPKGSYRSGTSPDGTKWRNMLACDYGDIRGTESVDGDPVGIYISDHPEKGAVFVIDQVDPKTKKFDKHKVMYGFDSIEDAKKTYLACYQKGWGGLGWITPVTKAEFRKWIDSSTRKTKPFHEYASVKPIVDTIKVKAAEADDNDDGTEKTAQAKDDPMEGVPAGVKLRSFIDAPATRTAIMDNVLEAVKNRFPIEDDDVRLELRDVKYEGPTSYTLEQQKQALLNNRRLGCSIAGTWRLTDKRTGQVLDERRDGIIRVPYYTDRGTIINNGNEYTVISQARLSPGVYVRRKQNGELESQFNVANGLGFRIGLDRETGALNMSVGQGHVPLYPVLRAMGVSDEEIRKSWGNDVTSVNVGKMDPRALDKVYARYAGHKADMSLSPADKAKFVSEALAGSGLDPEVVVRTLGLENVNGVTGAVILRAAQKLLNINRGAEDPDERDNPRFSKFYGVEDMMRERIDKDAGRLTKSILFRAKRDKNLARIGRNALAPYLDTFLSGSGLAMPGEEANPLSILTQQSRITRLGEGGISSPDLVTPEARNVQGDYLGYVDFISGPESFGIGIDVRAALGTMKGSDNRLYNKMMDLRTGKTRYVALDDAASHTVAFPGQDPKSPTLYAMRKGVPTMVPRDEVDFMVPGFGNTVSAGINMTPMPSTVQAGRQFYMSKFWEQYLPQKEGEVPLVDSLMDDGKATFSEFYGRKVGCLTAPFSGTVIKANDKEIVIRGKDGQTHTSSLVQGLPFNRMSLTGDTKVFIRRNGNVLCCRMDEYKFMPGDEVSSYDPHTCKSAWKRVKGFVRHENSVKLYRIGFESGRHVDCTENHSLLTMSDEFSLRPEYPKDCVVGLTKCPVVFPAAGENKDWSYDEGILDGLYLSEGCVMMQPSQKKDKDRVRRKDGTPRRRYETGTYTVCRIAVDPMDRRMFVAGLVERLGYKVNASCLKNVCGRSGSKSSGHVSWTSQSLAARWHDDFGQYANGKHISGHVFSRGRDYLHGLLAGYLAGDGCLWHDTYGTVQVEFGTVSKELQHDIVSLCGILGVFAMPRKAKPNGERCLDIYCSRISTSSLRVLHPLFGYPDRQAKLDALSKPRKVRANAFENIPVCTESAKKLLYASYPGKVPHSVYKTISNDKKAAKHRLFSCNGAVGRWANSDILWDTIVEINELPWQKYVYDFSVDDSEAFATANGTLVHNTGITYFSQVKKGDEVQEGGILANSNFTDAKTGAMNMGRNLKVAVLPAPAGVSSYEDAIVISEDAAKKLATSRLYGFEQDTKEGVQVARGKYLAAFPKVFTKAQADTIDDNGVVKVGTVLHRDDPMILAIGPKMLSAEDAQLGKLSSVLRNALTDKSQKWEHDWPGVVTDVVAGAHGVKVIVKSEPPVKVGDKLCYDEETEVLTSRGWVHFKDVTLDDNVATMNPDTFEFDYINPIKVMSYDHDGQMYKIKSQLIDLLVTPNHNMFVKMRGSDSFELLPAESIYGKRVSYKKDAKWVGKDVKWFYFPPYTVGHRWGIVAKPGVKMEMDTFLMLMGMYLSEGHSFDIRSGSGIRISQVKNDGVRICSDALKKAGIRFSFGGHQFTICGRWLYNYFKQFGHSYEKYIPDFVFGLSARQQNILYKWMMWGDGHRARGRDITYTTSSKRLADDFQRLCLHIGKSARIIHKDGPGSHRGMIDGREIVAKHDVYSVQIINSKLTPTVNHGHVRSQHIQEEGFVMYSGKVYCCTMPKWNVIFVRRGGNVCWCGNSPEQGLKGVVGGILPMDKMPRDAATNEPYDMLMNPMGFLSRVAPGQVMLMNLAKVAKKTGKQIRLPQLPPPEGWLAWTEKQMADAGVKETADVFDPQSGRTIRNVGDGYSYVKAFHHLAEKKYSARGVDGAYTQDEQPAKGGVDGAKRISGFDNLALLSHGATEVIKDSMVTRGQCFDEETEVLTRHGWKLWREVSTSDELLTKAKEGDGTAFYEVPERLVVNDYDGIMYGYENRHIDWLVTPDHDLWGINCLVPKNKTYRHYRTFKAKDIFGKEGTIDAFGAIYPGSLTRDHVLEFRDDRTTRGKGSVKEVKMDLFDYCAFMGWWLSEGCASYDGKRGEIRISQDAAIHPKEFAEILSLGVKIGLGNGCLSRKTSASPFGGRSPIGTPTSIRWQSKPFALHLMNFGTRAWDKRIPEVIFEAPLDCRMEFLRCYSLGDGCRRYNGHGHYTFNDSIGTASPMMMHDLQRLAVISGLSARIGLDKKAGEYNYKHDYYRVVISGNTKETTIKKMPSARFKGHYKLHYSGRVYCATMSTGLVYVRRNGKCMWSGNCNDEFWRRYRLGLPVEEPGVPFIYKKFLNTLRAGGVNVVEKGDVTSIMPQTDADIDELAQGRVLENSQMVDADMNPVKGGLFDLGHTGGMGGNRWSMITLPEAVPNPMMEEPVRRVLGLTAKKMEAILSGREELNGKTGGDAIKEALSKLDVDDAIERARSDIKSRRGSQRDNAIKVLGYLKAAKEMGKKPEEWMITKVPVLPPMFRPVARMGDVALIPDMNELYKDLIEMKGNYEALSKELPASALADERLAVYGAVKAAYGLGDPITAEGQAKNLKGAIRQVIGTIPKFGMYQSKVISKTQDNVGRSVTIPDKNLDMDQIGIPEEMAWEMYKPHVERKLIQRGYSPLTAKQMIEEKNATARHILDDAMEERPVLMDRAPTWHKFNIMAFKPHIVKGRSIHVCPLIDSGFNMDHDGDQQIGSVKITLTGKALEDFNKSKDPSCINIKTLIYYALTHQERSCVHAD